MVTMVGCLGGHCLPQTGSMGEKSISCATLTSKGLGRLPRVAQGKIRWHEQTTLQQAPHG